MRPSPAVTARGAAVRAGLPLGLPPSLRFGLRTACAGMLALYVAFSLQIDEPSWAATSAIIVAQPVLGASLRKGLFRLIGTWVGAVFAVLLYVAFPQDRAALLLGLALWGGLCSFVSTFLREFAAYAAMLAGYTTAIIAMESVASPGGVFLLAIDRGSAIAIGIVCTTLVFSVTDRGRQRAVLASRIDSLTVRVLEGMRGVLGADPEPLDRQRDRRRALVAEVAALDTVVDQAVGENYDLRSRIGGLRAALTGLLRGLACWRGMEQHVRRMPVAERPLIKPVRQALEATLPPAQWRVTGMRLRAAAAATVSQRLLSDLAGEGLIGLAAAHDGMLLLRDPLHARATVSQPAMHVSDPLAALVNAVRTTGIVGAAELVWVLSGWPSGPTVVIFAMVVVMLFALRDEAAFAGAACMTIGTALALLAAGAIKFAVLPLAQSQGFDGFGVFAAAVGGMVFVSATAAAALSQGTALAAIAFGATANFMPLFAPTNAIVYDYAGFLEGGLAIMVGATLGAAGYRWLPPLPPRLRARRAVSATRGDLRRLLSRRWRPDQLGWARRLYVRLVQLPPQATLQQHAQVLAVFSVGEDVLRSRSLRGAADLSAADAMRLDAAQRGIGEAVASHPQVFAGLDLQP